MATASRVKLLYRKNAEPTSTYLSKANKKYLEYKIGYVEFCYEPLQRKSLLSMVKTFFKFPHSAEELPNEVVRDVRGLLRGIPSRHHRFVHFRATGGLRDNLKIVFGTMELNLDEAVCYLYATSDLCDRHYSKVHGALMAEPTTSLSIKELFQSAWNYPYDLLHNNCIDYAIRCWNQLRPRQYSETDDGMDRIMISYNDVYQAVTV